MSENLFNLNDSNSDAVIGAELAEWLGVTPAAVTGLKKRGVIKIGIDGKYPLKQSVTAYINSVKKTKARQNRKTLDEQLKYWQVENAKTKNSQWRLDYGRQLIIAYRDHHRASLEEFRRSIANIPAAVKAALKLADAARNTDIEDVLYEVSDDEVLELADD